MSDNAAAPVVTSQTSASTLPNGDKLVASTTSTTTSTPVPATYGPTGYVKGIGDWAALLLAVAALAALVAKFLTKDVNRDIRDQARRIDEIEEEAQQFKPREALEQDRKEIDNQIASLKHRHADEITKVGARVHFLEQARIADVERIVRVETNLQNIKESQARLEQATERNHRETLEAMKAWADQFSTSIREIRNVTKG